MGLVVFYVIFFKSVFINSLSSYLGQFMSMNNCPWLFAGVNGMLLGILYSYSIC